MPPTAIKPASAVEKGTLIPSQNQIMADGGDVTPSKDVEEIAIPQRKLPRHPGWNIMPHQPLPQPTYWPTVAAGGVVLLAFGFVTSFAFWVIGFVLFVAGLAGWIGEVRFERKHKS